MSEEGSTSTDDRHVFADRMTGNDALIWAIEKDPLLRSTITTVLLLDERPDPDALAHIFDRASRAVPRLRQRVRSNPLSVAPPRWEVDPNFDLRYHLRSAGVTGEGSIRDLLEMTAPIAMQGFDRARPLWEATVVEGMAEGRGAIILKIHHSITDGVGGMELMMEILDLAPDAPKRELGDEPPVHVMNQLERFIDALVYESRRTTGSVGGMTRRGFDALRSIGTDPVGAYNAATEMVGSMIHLLQPESRPLSTIAGDRSLSSTLDVLSMPLDAAKEAGRRLGGSINDVFLAGIIVALDRYHGQHGANQQRLRIGMPINVRGAVATQGGGNEWVPSRFVVDIRHESLEDLVEHIHRRAAEARDEPANALLTPLANLMNRLPTTVVTQLFGMILRGLDVQASNVPGAPFPLYIGGTRITAIYPFGPLAGAGMNITLLSYENDLNIGLNIDPASITDADMFVELLRDAYDEILTSTK